MDHKNIITPSIQVGRLLSHWLYQVWLPGHLQAPKYS